MKNFIRDTLNCTAWIFAVYYLFAVRTGHTDLAAYLLCALSAVALYAIFNKRD